MCAQCHARHCVFFQVSRICISCTTSVLFPPSPAAGPLGNLLVQAFTTSFLFLISFPVLTQSTHHPTPFARYKARGACQAIFPCSRPRSRSGMSSRLISLDSMKNGLRRINSLTPKEGDANSSARKHFSVQENAFEHDQSQDTVGCGAQMLPVPAVFKRMVGCVLVLAFLNCLLDIARSRGDCQ